MTNKWDNKTFKEKYGDVIWEKEDCKKKSYETEAGNYNTTLEICQGIPVLRFSVFEPCKDWMGMGFSTRLGGVSKGFLSQLNLGWNRGESDDNVRQNYRLICQALGVEPENLVFSDQVHETEIAKVTKKEAAGRHLKKKLQGIDGLVTREAGLVLATSYADCVPLFFADETHHVVASAHSGWRGTVGEIGRKTIEKMGAYFQTRPEDIKCLVGPSICQDCYEVSEDVAQQFSQKYSGKQLEEILTPGKEPGKYQLDLWAACYFTLQKAGVSPENIQVSRVCTCCHNDLLFSHRFTAGKRGNLNGFIWKHAVPAAPGSVL